MNDLFVVPDFPMSFSGTMTVEPIDNDTYEELIREAATGDEHELYFCSWGTEWADCMHEDECYNKWTFFSIDDMDGMLRDSVEIGDVILMSEMDHNGNKYTKITVDDRTY